MWGLDYKDNWVLRNWCFWTVVSEKTLESPWTARRWILSIHWKDWCWSWNSSSLGTWCGELSDLKRPWCWERLKAEGEGDVRGQDGWMASPSQWTLVWVSSGSLRGTGNPGVLQSMGLQRVGHNWMTELNSTLPYWTAMGQREIITSPGINCRAKILKKTVNW